MKNVRSFQCVCDVSLILCYVHENKESRRTTLAGIRDLVIDCGEDSAINGIKTLESCMLGCFDGDVLFGVQTTVLRGWLKPVEVGGISLEGFEISGKSPGIGFLLSGRMSFVDPVLIIS